MMTLSPYTHFYFIGAGGIGMSALARHFKGQNFYVAGYDKTSTQLTRELEQEGIALHFEDDVRNIPKEITGANKAEVLVVYTPAIPKGHKEFIYLQEQGFAIYKRSEVLGGLTAGKQTIAVAGTHGKTSTAAFIAHILKVADVPFQAFLGGISSNYQTNYISPKSDQAPEVIVVEADEFDRSFLHLSPDVSIITAVESDHLDIYGTVEELGKAYEAFAQKTKPGGTLIVQEDVRISLPDDRRVMRYGIKPSSRINAAEITVREGGYYFDAHIDNEVLNLMRIGVPGIHNIENCLAAMAATWQLVKNKNIYARALNTYTGVHRRFEVVLRNQNVVLIDDYAHHPTEIRVTLETVKKLYPDKKILGIFQPHLFSRTRDLAGAFAESLSILDELLLLPIYPARELPMEGVTSSLILDQVTTNYKKLVSKEALINEVVSRRPDIVVTLGAGDIDRMVQPLKEALLNRKNIKVAS